MNQKFKTHCKWLLIAPYLLLLANSVMAQQVFKCTNQHGRTVYSDRPCKEADRKAETIRAVPNTLDMTEARAQELRARIKTKIASAKHKKMRCAGKHRKSKPNTNAADNSTKPPWPSHQTNSHAKSGGQKRLCQCTKHLLHRS